MWKEFKAFALKGNVLDLAVGVIIGGAFGKIVASLVNDVVMPLFGLLLGNMNFKALKIVLKAAEGDLPESAILYGNFIQNIVDFTIIALVIFLVVKSIGKMKKKEVETPVAPELPSAETILLTEIRDLLKK